MTEPHAVLGVAPDAPPGELAAAYRELAKRWHPDRGGGPESARRMAEINAAYDLLRSDAWQAGRRGRAARARAARSARRASARAPGARPRERGCRSRCGARSARSC